VYIIIYQIIWHNYQPFVSQRLDQANQLSSASLIDRKTNAHICQLYSLCNILQAFTTGALKRQYAIHQRPIHQMNTDYEGTLGRHGIAARFVHAELERHLDNWKRITTFSHRMQEYWGIIIITMQRDSSNLHHLRTKSATALFLAICKNNNSK